MKPITKTKIIAAKNLDALSRKVRIWTFKGGWHPFGEVIPPFTISSRQKSFRQQIVLR